VQAPHVRTGEAGRNPARPTLPGSVPRATGVDLRRRRALSRRGRAVSEAGAEALSHPRTDLSRAVSRLRPVRRLPLLAPAARSAGSADQRARSRADADDAGARPRRAPP